MRDVLEASYPAGDASAAFDTNLRLETRWSCWPIDSVVSLFLFLFTGMIIVSNLPCCSVSLSPSSLSLYLATGRPSPDYHTERILA